MKITSAIAENITTCFEGNNWTDVSVDDVLKDVDWHEAQQKNIASPNTIVSLVNHLYYWNHIIMQRIKGENPSIHDSNGFDVKKLSNEDDWNSLKDETHQSFMQLADAIKNFPEEKLEETYAEGKSSYYKNFQGIIEHAYYHLGQIVTIKKLIKAEEKK